MDAATNGVAEEQDDQQGIDQQDVLYRMVLFLATVTVRLLSRVLGADNASFRPVMSKRGGTSPPVVKELSRADGCPLNPMIMISGGTVRVKPGPLGHRQRR